jgi:hypothetical protein
MLTAEDRLRYSEILRHPGNRTRSELCRELKLSYLELSRVLAELGLRLPPARRDPDRMNVPREKLEELVQAGMNRSQIQIALGLSNRGLMRLLKQFGLEVLSPAQRNRQLEMQGLRQCIECRQVKSLASDFYNDRTNPLGKNRRCKECLNRWSIWHRQQAKLPEAERVKADSRTPWANQGLRRCRRCHQVKSLATDFPESPNERGGHSVCCRACHAIRQAQADAQRQARELAAQGLRRCTRCQQIKPLESGFGVNRRDAQGRQTRCRACQQEINRQKRQPATPAQAIAPDPLPTPNLTQSSPEPTPAQPALAGERPAALTSLVPGAARSLGTPASPTPPQSRLPTATVPLSAPRPALPGEPPRAAA